MKAGESTSSKFNIYQSDMVTVVTMVITESASRKLRCGGWHAINLSQMWQWWEQNLCHCHRRGLNMLNTITNIYLPMFLRVNHWSWLNVTQLNCMQPSFAANQLEGHSSMCRFVGILMLTTILAPSACLIFSLILPQLMDMWSILQYCVIIRWKGAAPSMIADQCSNVCDWETKVNMSHCTLQDILVTNVQLLYNIV